MAAIKSIKVGEITYDLKATYDGSGNNIVETYAKSSAIPTKVSLLDNDENYLTEHLDISGLATQELVKKKVDKELGKGLSEANYTKSEKQKLEGVETGANKYVHPAGTNPHGTTKADVGLGNVDNTSDANKPVSTAQQTALNAKMDSSKFQVVESLPASPVSGTFYFVKE